ncbi:ABC transporter transmembrane domain-containing protein [Pseudochelatococcus sp. B33]
MRTEAQAESAAAAGFPATDGPAKGAGGQKAGDQKAGSPEHAGHSTGQALRILLPFAWRYRGRVVAALVALLVAAGATLALPLAVRRVIDYGFSGLDTWLINAYFLMLAVVVGVLALASATRYYFVTTLGERVVADLRTATFRHLVTLDQTFYDTARTGELTSRLAADTTQIKSAFGSSISQALRNLVIFIGASAMMVITSPPLSALVLAAIPLIVLPLVFSGRGVRKRSRAAQDTLAAATAYATEAIGAVRTMQAFNAEAQATGHFRDAAEEAYVAARLSARARAALTAVALFLVGASIVAVLWYGAQAVLAGEMTGGRLSQFVLYAVLAASSLGELSQVWGEVSQTAGAAGRLSEILATRSGVVSPAAPQPLPEPPLATVALDRVRFAYPTRPETAALDGVDIHVARGERVALVGPSGAGKSTVFQLLQRFYDPLQGRVLIDRVDAREADLAALRRRFAIVPQDPVIFGASVADNIRYGAPEADFARIETAARQAAAHDFIAALPQGYDTLVGERGVTLSGGQRQRLAIARAILRDAPVLLLDEATSALDAESERLVQAALDRLMQGRTTLVIAHRLATVLSADRILVMDRGRIVEEGTHATLVADGGLYARLARLQFGAAGEQARAFPPADLPAARQG